MADGLTETGGAMFAQGDLGGARGAYEEALAIVRRLATAAPEDPRLQGRIAASLGYVGGVLSAQHDPAGARKAYEESLAIFRRLTAASPSEGVLRQYVATTLWALAELPGAQVRWSDVVAQLQSLRDQGMLPLADAPRLAEAQRRAAAEALK